MINKIKELEEKRYQSALREFSYKNPNATEEFYIKYRIRIIKKVLVEYEETANFVKGEELDGKELIDGVLTTTKMGTATAYILFDKEVSFLKDKLKQLKNPKQPEAEQPGKTKDYKKETVFLTGLKFATGEAQDSYKSSKKSFEKLAIDLGFKDTDRPYFSATINSNKGIKNLYKNKDVMLQLHKHCIENNIVMCEEFLNKYSQIEPD